MSTSKTPTTYPLLTSSLFDKIKNDILDGKYVPGDKLNESSLARQNDVSRTPIREALKQLVAEGIVDSIPNRGYVVVGFTDNDLKDINDIRTAMRHVAIRWAVQRMDDKELSDLNDIFDLMEFYTQRNAIDRVFDLITKFHEAIYRSIQSPFMEKVLVDHLMLTRSVRFQSLSKPDRLLASLEEHRLILNAFKTRDMNALADLLDHHMTAVDPIIDAL